MTRLRKAALLSTLYIAQGLPYGFFTQALPVLLRKASYSLPMIGLANLLTLPWALKFLLAPAVDRFHFPKLGLRRSWLLPLQVLSIALYASMSLIDFQTSVTLVMAAFLITNLFAASQDIATDALAIDVLEFSERGWANGIQVGCYRVGMIIGGGLLLAAYDVLQWQGTMIAMAVVCLICTWPVFAYDEPRALREKPPKTETRGAKPKVSVKDMLRFFLEPGALPWLAVLLIYKFGHTAATTMMRPWLVDGGYKMTEIAWVLGIAGFVAGLCGALIGGALAGKYDRKKLLILLGSVQVFGVASYLWPVLTEHETMKVVVATALDNLTSGMATTVLFTIMMDVCDRERAATDYTAQACAVVISQSAAASLAGFTAQYFGYGAHFAMSAVIGFLGVGFTLWVLKSDTLGRLRGLRGLGSQAASALIFAGCFIGGAAIIIQPSSALAQNSGKAAYEFSIHSGPLLPAHIPGVTQIMEMVGGRVSFRTSKGVIEFDGMSGRGDGQIYTSGAADYRLDVDNMYIPAHFLAGVNADTYERPGRPSQYAGGWHYGGGFSAPLTAHFHLRTDFVYRFAPGNSLYVSVGLVLLGGLEGGG